MASTSSTTSSVVSSLSSSLGINLGFDTTSLVSSLTQAAYGDKISAVNSQISDNSAQISALASAKSSLDTFSSALTSLLKSSAYTGTPGTTNPSIASVTPIPGGTPQGLPATIMVNQLAQSQVLQSAALASATAVAGTGTLTLAVGGKSYDITLGASSNTLSDLASSINSSGAGVTASVVTDKNGARLVLKGATGADQAFTLTAGTDADADLQRFTFDGTTGPMSKTLSAQDALISIDGVDMQFATNTVTTAIPNLSIELNSAAPGTSVTIATDEPTSSMSDLVQQVVDAYNTLKGALNTATRTSDGTTSAGLLQNDTGVRAMVNTLAKLTSTTLSSDGTYKTLSDIGVSTNNDGTLTLDTTRLSAVLASDPAAVVQMLNPTVKDDNHPGIAGALANMVTYLEGTDGPLSASKNTYDKLASSYQDKLDTLNTQESDYSSKLTDTYAALQTKLMTIKSTQSYLQQQIDAWNNSGN